MNRSSLPSPRLCSGGIPQLLPNRVPCEGGDALVPLRVSGFARFQAELAQCPGAVVLRLVGGLELESELVVIHRLLLLRRVDASISLISMPWTASISFFFRR